jgi:hypothetical protein
VILLVGRRKGRRGDAAVELGVGDGVELGGANWGGARGRRRGGARRQRRRWWAAGSDELVGGGTRGELVASGSGATGRGASSWRRDPRRQGLGRARGGGAWGELGVGDGVELGGNGGGRVMCSVFETIERKTEVEPDAAALSRRCLGAALSRRCSGAALWR